LKKNNLIQVFEYQKLKYTDTNDFTESHLNELVKFNELNSNKFFTPIHNGIQFNSYVGVIQVGKLIIEILPKADRNESPNVNLWQEVLLDMLKICNELKVDNTSESSLKIKNNSILDLYFEMYLNELESLIHKGLIKKYRKLRSNQTALKGKLLFSQNIQKNNVHQEYFYCEHNTYDKDHLIHQILLKGLLVLDCLVSANLKDKVNRLLSYFEDIQRVNINKSHFDKIVNNRKNTHYQKALSIAKMIILNYSPNLNSGSNNMIALLFDMNKLWEEYIFRILLKNASEEYEVSYQNSEDFWEYKTIRPDIVIKAKNQTYIIDTKWKIVDNTNPSDNDLKQMFTYNLHWEAKRSILLYPKIDQKDSKFGIYHYNGLEYKCKLGFVNLISNEGKLRNGKELSSEILDKFKN
jgi:5-methylcytosine-specific restriction enzyme subunit McrC